MALIKLKEINQKTWLHSGGGPSRNGVCYYMCNYLESNLGIWNKPLTFKNAIESAQNFAQGTAMMSYAKTQNLEKYPQTSNYSILNGATLVSNRIYRVWLQIDEIKKPSGNNNPNHEIIVVTGDGNDITYFEPNFGFYQASNQGMNNTQALEYFIKQQYGVKYDVKNFGYLNVRGITSQEPLSFKTL